MKHISDWHVLERSDLKTYPKVAAPIQVKYADGTQAEGVCRSFFSCGKVAVDATIVLWRYIRDGNIE
jgi:hypothetical protein